MSIIKFYLILPLILKSVLSGYVYDVEYITVPVDHFSFSNGHTFNLKYLINDTYWNSKRGPIFFYAGGEDTIEVFCDNTGFVWEIAERFQALVVFAEHRYYGESLPYGHEESFKGDRLGYLNSQQALADFVDLIAHLRGPPCPKTGKHSNPVIAFGGSYGGMLASWFRMKYPTVVEGAIASSAPIWQFTGMTPCNAFYNVTSNVYTDTSAECGASIRASWKAIDNVTESDEGKKWLSDSWKLCQPLQETSDVIKLKLWAWEVYVSLAMVNYPYPADFLAPLPGNPIREVCKSMTDHKQGDRTLLESVFGGLSVYFNHTGAADCLNFSTAYPEEMMMGWNYQACTEMIMPLCSNGVTDIFEAYGWDFEGYADYCQQTYGVMPKTDTVEKEYGGKYLKAASNIVFSNGLLDPWSSGGVLHSVSTSVRAIVMPDTAHHLDLRASHHLDPKSVKKARNEIQRWINKWIYKYHCPY
ncbi:lysosomal Pro-X carboxypeptidase-like [Adelges cooleyi]|uniref:lysosomal Pro-X carboxypeptidase-like n=1 Tax=Adelges cooleyi TaxID=133065 RepID=UPI00217FF8A4|nr:lysosomal Pro-X carboxypeptidase-like [Adelges cooleyi]